MTCEKLRRCLDEGNVSLGSWIGSTDLYIIEIMGQTGFDWVLIDVEHCPIGISDLRAMIPILEATGTSTIVRVPDRGEYWIKQALDVGADGVMVPRVDSAELARQAVYYSRYHPLGERGFGPTRAAGFFKGSDYVQTANQQCLLFVQLEHRLAAENLDEILDVNGIDGYFIGPGDLSQSLGFLGQTGAEKVQQVRQGIIDKLNERGKVWGSVALDAEDFRRYVDLGSRITTLGGDLVCVGQGAPRNLDVMQKIVAECQTP